MLKTEAERTKALQKIKDEILKLDSFLAKERIKNKVFPVIGEGSPFADIMFIGEAPGKNEAATGRPFCGASGRILDGFLNDVGLKRENVYITNIVKDRPPENRDPTPDEIEQYGPFLDRQLEIIRPKVIATLGRFSMDYVMKRCGLEFEIIPISQAHGKIYKGKTVFGTDVTIVPLYHPAASIYNQHLKETLREDFKIMKKFIEK
jgi:uracil-DNA glycosylase family 4